MRDTAAPASVQVRWWCNRSPVDKADWALLSEAERSRADRFRFPRDRTRFIGSRATAKRIIGATLGVPPEAVELGHSPCPGCGSPEHGPPAVRNPDSGLGISLSHSEGYSAIALSAHGGVGLDIEYRRDIDIDLLSATTLSSAERAYVAEQGGVEAFLRCWTRKEAVLKAAGVGVQGDLAEIDVHPHIKNEAVAVHHTVGGVVREWAVQDISVHEGLVAAIATPAIRR